MSDSTTYVVRSSSALAPGTETGKTISYIEELVAWYVNCTVASGGGSLVVTLYGTADGTNYAAIPGATATITATGMTRIVPTLNLLPDVDIRAVCVATTGTYTFTIHAVGKSLT